jgi:HAD superfamily hydrolase (TIGR01549 family)
MPLEIDRIRALCFDVDGTLSDTDDQWINRLETWLNPLHRFFPRRQLRSFARRVVMALESPGNTLYTLLDRLNLKNGMARFYSLASKHNLMHRSRNFWLVPKVKDTLLAFDGHYPMAIVSARDHESTYYFLKQFSIRHLFQAVATSQTCRHTKPFPDPVVWAAGQLNVNPHECLMIGDTTVDIYAGRAAGAQTVGVLCGFGYEGELRRAGADLILPSTADLLEVLSIDHHRNL